MGADDCHWHVDASEMSGWRMRRRYGHVEGILAWRIDASPGMHFLCSQAMWDHFTDFLIPSQTSRNPLVLIIWLMNGRRVIKAHWRVIGITYSKWYLSVLSINGPTSGVRDFCSARERKMHKRVTTRLKLLAGQRKRIYPPVVHFLHGCVLYIILHEL